MSVEDLSAEGAGPTGIPFASGKIYEGDVLKFWLQHHNLRISLYCQGNRERDKSDETILPPYDVGMAVRDRLGGLLVDGGAILNPFLDFDD